MVRTDAVQHGPLFFEIVDELLVLLEEILIVGLDVVGLEGVVVDSVLEHRGFTLPIIYNFK